MISMFKCGYIQREIRTIFPTRYCEMNDEQDVDSWDEIEVGGSSLGAAIVRVDAPESVINKLNTNYPTDIKDIMTNQTTRDTHYTYRRMPVIDKDGVIACTGDLVRPPKPLEELGKNGLSDNFNIR